MDVGSLLLEQQKSLFIGRNAEWARLHQTLSAPKWTWLHLYGPGGIGKTTLSRLFAQSVGQARCFYIDGHRGIQCPADFLTLICESLQVTVTEDPAEAADLLSAYAAQHRGLILLLDTFEQWGAIENWLRNEWLPKLSPQVRVCSAGRYPLEGQWLRGEWGLLVDNVELQPFSSQEMQLYTYNRGIRDRRIVSSLQCFSNGLPLALSIACEIITRTGNARLLDQQQQSQMTRYLVSELTRDIRNPLLKRYTEAASMLWRFDQELLQALLQEPVSAEPFREFCRLPYVIRQADRWILHDAVRQWTFADLRSRMPETFHRYKERALKELWERATLMPHRKTDLAFEKIYLHGLDLVRDFRFQWDDSLRFRGCKESDLAQVERLYREHTRSQLNYMPEEKHLEDLIRPLWQIDPAAFFGLWREEKLVAFCSCVPLTAQTVRIFRSNPITEPITARFRPDGRQYLVSLTGVAAHLEFDISGALARSLVRLLDHRAEIFNLISVPYWSRYLPLLGFERATWGDAATPKGVKFTGYRLDLRTKDLASHLNRLYRINSAATGTVECAAQVSGSGVAWPGETQAQLSLEEAAKLVQRALKHFPRLPLQPKFAPALRPLLGESAHELEAEAVARQVQERILDIVQSFSEGSKEERRFHQLLYNAYIKKIGTHEFLAKQLNIPSQSYYRYLRAAVRALTYEMTKM